MFVPLITMYSKGIGLMTVVSSLLALLGTGFLELGDAHSSWSDLWCVAQALGFGVAFTRIEVLQCCFFNVASSMVLLPHQGMLTITCLYSITMPDYSQYA